MCRLWLEIVRKLGFLCLAIIAFAQCARAAEDGQRGFVNRVFKNAGREHRYVVFVPKNYSAAKAWPVILFLHGAGERGNDGQSHLNVGLGSLVKSREATFPAIVVFPQCEDTRSRVLQGWLSGTPDARRALGILAEVEQDYRTDSQRRILSGWSMGGFGAWSLAAADPLHWSCVVPLSAGGQSEWAEKLRDLPIWAWHGESDGAVVVNRSREMIDALKSAGASPRYTEIPAGDHDSWKIAFGDDRLIAWMLDPKLDPDKLPVPKERVPPQLVVADPFVPALEVPRAIYARLGNQMLDALAYAAPAQIPADMLTGRVKDIVDSTNVEGRNFRVQFSGISYRGKVQQVRIKGVGPDRLSLQVGLKDAVLNVGRTWVTGESHAAQAGAMQAVIGHRYPVWLEVDVQPVVENRRVRLKQIAAKFNIPDDNWYVTAPAGVSVQGFGMTRGRVSNGLVNGVYGNKQRIQNEVLAVAPKLIETLEKRIAELGDARDLTSRFWPLPVYKPRVQLWPQSISTDENGVTMVLGLSAAAVGPKSAPQLPEVVELKSELPADLPQQKSLQVGLVPEVLEPLTELLVKADVARIHVLDIPEDTFAKFADRSALSAAIPELKRRRDGELWSEMSLASGISVADVTEQAGPTKVEFHVSKLFITTSLKSDSKLTPFAQFEVELKQKSAAELLKPDTQTRALKFGWDGAPELKVTGRFAAGYSATDSTINNELVQQWLSESWQAWTGLSPVATVKVPDLDFGLTKLRLSKAGWATPHLFAVFTPPGVKITNSSSEPFTYETKGPYSDWGGPYKLLPGNSDEFEIAYPLTYRRNGEVYTLFPGSHSEFREPMQGGAPRLFQARE